MRLIGGQTVLGRLASDADWQHAVNYLATIDRAQLFELRKLMTVGMSQNPALLKIEVKRALNAVRDGNARGVLTTLDALLTYTKEFSLMVAK